jgi:hypothetical protein
MNASASATLAAQSLVCWWVYLRSRVVRLVHERQVHLGQVDQFDLVESAVRHGLVAHPPRDRQADPAGTGARDDDLQLGHGGCSRSREVQRSTKC